MSVKNNITLKKKILSRLLQDLGHVNYMAWFYFA